MELHPLLLSTVVGETEIAIRFFTKKKIAFLLLMQKGLTICSTFRLSKILISCDKIITNPGASPFIAFSQTEE
jgi:hypothetical protein